MLCIAAVWKRCPDAKVLIVVPTVALMDQWRVALLEEFDFKDDDVGLVGGGARRPRETSVVLGVVDSLRSKASELTGTGKWFLIVDECHRAGSPANRTVLNGNYVATLGLSATPERQYDDFFETVVATNLGPIVYRYGYEDASRDGVISDFELWNLRVLPNEDEQNQLSADNRAIHMESRRLLDIGVTSSKRLEHLRLRRSRHSQKVSSRIAASITFVDRFKGRRGLVFHESIESVNTIAAELGNRGHRVRPYHSQLGAPTRYLNLLLYIRGQIDVLVTCRALDEGLDVPKSEFGIISASTASVRQRIQRLGRVLRPHPDKETATVLTIYVLPSEAEKLRIEAAKLDGIANVRWFEAK